MPEKSLKLIRECKCGRYEEEIPDDKKHIPVPILFCRDCKQQVVSTMEDV